MVSRKTLESCVKNYNQPIAVKWFDAVSEPSWEILDDVTDERYDIWTVGFPIKIGKDYLTLAQNWASNTKVSCTMAIPVHSISEIRRLDDRRPRAKRGKK